MSRRATTVPGHKSTSHAIRGLSTVSFTLSPTLSHFRICSSGRRRADNCPEKAAPVVLNEMETIIAENRSFTYPPKMG